MISHLARARASHQERRSSDEKMKALFHHGKSSPVLNSVGKNIVPISKGRLRMLILG